MRKILVLATLFASLACRAGIIAEWSASLPENPVWRGEKFNAAIRVTTSDKVENLTVRCDGPVSGKHSISASRVKVNFLTDITGDELLEQ